MMTRRGMHYHCGNCGYHAIMWLDDTLETHDENHKPVPFMISCPNCAPGHMAHVAWNEDIYLHEPMPLTEDMNRFENREDCECGYAMFGDKRPPKKMIGGEL